MRKKGVVWEDEYQRLIVESYKGGMFISEIMSLPEINRLSPSEYTIRNILKANGVQASWKKKKRKPEFWRTDIVDKIVELRNEGKSIRAIRDTVNTSVDGSRTSKSTIVRVLEANADRILFKPSQKRNIWKPHVTRQIVKMYESGKLINDICRSELLREFRPSSYIIRDILKKHGVKLTWKKGELRRWPEDLQKKIAALYRSGLKFSSILNHPELKPYNPTNYAVRKILKKYGVKTKGETRYKQPISEERFRSYRYGRLSVKEEAIIHKHLAVNADGRKRMVERMRLDLADKIPPGDQDAAKVRILKSNIQHWADFFSWAIRNFSNESVKKRIILLGLTVGSALRSLRSALRGNDSAKKQQAWARTEHCMSEMADLYNEVLVKPANSFEIKAIS